MFKGKFLLLLSSNTKLSIAYIVCQISRFGLSKGYVGTNDIGIKIE